MLAAKQSRFPFFPQPLVCAKKILRLSGSGKQLPGAMNETNPTTFEWFFLALQFNDWSQALNSVCHNLRYVNRVKFTAFNKVLLLFASEKRGRIGISSSVRSPEKVLPVAQGQPGRAQQRV